MDEELLHYGILGMHWGIRRYQNYDGTLTNAGKRRKRNGGESSGPSNKSNGQGYDPSQGQKSQVYTSNNYRPKSASEMTDEELRAFLNRVDMERRYNAIINPPEKPKEKSAAVKFIEGIALTAAKTVATEVATNALKSIIYKNKDKDKDKEKDKKDKKDKKDDDLYSKLSDRLSNIEKNVAISGYLNSGSSSNKKNKSSSDIDDAYNFASDWLHRNYGYNA